MKKYLVFTVDGKELHGIRDISEHLNSGYYAIVKSIRKKESGTFKMFDKDVSFEARYTQKSDPAIKENVKKYVRREITGPSTVKIVGNLQCTYSHSGRLMFSKSLPQKIIA